MSDNELLLALSDMMNKKLKAAVHPIENRLDRIENKVTNISLTLGNDIRPRLSTILNPRSGYNEVREFH